MKTDKQPTAGIVLAAGMSTRLGRAKQLLELNGKYLVEWVIDAALESKLVEIILVLGHEQQKILDALGNKADLPRVQVVPASGYREGLSRSLQSGLAVARRKYPSVMFLLGDQPLVTAKTINWLLEEFWKSDKDICLPVYRGKRGNPTLFSQKLFDELATIQGDIGARNVIEAHLDGLHYVEVKEPQGFFDVDTEKDLAAIKPFLP
ncbi:MAG: nucleotidyltransferase family protein [Proteobacteria bacterium]|nr:nucleotidyltransferase family protein [Pseudomonadota bacterium]